MSLVFDDDQSGSVNNCRFTFSKQGIVIVGSVTTSASITDCEFLSNTGPGISGLEVNNVSCDAIHCATFEISRNLFENNAGNSALLLDCHFGTGYIFGNSFKNNVVSEYVSSVDFELQFLGGNVWVSNTVSTSNFIHWSNSRQEMNVGNNSLINNAVLSGVGDAFVVEGRHVSCFANLTAANWGCTGMNLLDTSLWSTWATLNAHDNNSWNNTIGNYAGSLLDSTNITADPLFCDAASGDYHIRNSSPCAPANNHGGYLIGAYGIGCENVAPSQFDLSSPPNSFMPPIATRTPALEWNAAIDTDPLDQVTYSLHLALDSNFLFAIVVPNISSESYLIEQPLNWSSRFWWKVKAVDLHGGETWSSQTFRFRTMTLGDADGSGAVTIVDVVYLVNFIFAGGPLPTPMEAGDPNCDGRYNITDLVYLINFIFADGAAPCEG